MGLGLKEPGFSALFDDAWRGAAIASAPRLDPADDHAPDEWEDWLRVMHPGYVTQPFADHHVDFWEHVWAVEPETSPRPAVSIWSRGGGKSTNAELAAESLGLRGRRRYCLYVCSTQDSADKHVATIGSLLESSAVASHYPKHAERAVGKYGQSIGWRRERLVTAGGFLVDAAGLDTAVRGLKFEDQRPDLIILDDLDDEHDSPHVTAKKIRTLTKSILPAGAPNVAIIAIQNLIIPDGIFTRMADGRADYLAERMVLGPHPAVRDMETEYRHDPETGTRKAMIVAGEATWEGQDLTRCQHLMDHIGLSAFLKECQHEVSEDTEGLALRYNDADHLEDLDHERAVEIVQMGQCFGGIDFGAWRFGFVLRAVDRESVVHQIAELFSQRETLTERAERIDDLLRDGYDLGPPIPIWGDAANPQDIMEINQAFRRVASRKGAAKPFTVVPVSSENKIRAASVDRINDLLDRHALRYRRGVGPEMRRVLEGVYGDDRPELGRWRLNFNASSQGEEMEGSRLLWEVKHWKYPTPKEGEAQKQDPDDHTADGADLIAADRYALMSWWRRPKDPEPDPLPTHNYDRGFEEMVERYNARKKKGGRGF